MPNSKIEVYIHFVWATWDRLPLLTPDLERRIHRNIAAQAHAQKCRVLAINGLEDHVHALLKLPSTLCLADCIKNLKGISSHLANDINDDQNFKWQGAYGAFSVSRWDVGMVRGYINEQKERHARNNLLAELEAVFEETSP